MKLLLLVGLLSAINRMRGDDTWKPAWLPGRALFYASGAVALLALLAWPPVIALVWGLTYLVWGFPAWGRWFDLGRLPDGFARWDVKPDPFERIINAISFGNDHAALFGRHLLMILPGLALLGFLLGVGWLPTLAVPFALAALLSYEAGWLYTPKSPIRTAELLTGGVWGLMIGGLSYVV